jgi:hypothetical protein
MSHFTELETQIFSKKNSVINNTPRETILPQYNKGQLKEHVVMFIKSMISKHADNATIELLLKDVSKLFTEWRNNNNLSYEIDNTNLGVVIHHLKIKGITKGRRQNTGNMKKFNIKEIKDYFNEKAAS